MKYSIAVLLLVQGSNAVNLEREPLTGGSNNWAFTKKQIANGPDHPMDYFVPDFGKDKEIGTTQKSITDTEKNMGHLLTFGQKKEADEHPINYAVPDFGPDHDVKTTLVNAGNAEAQYGHFWDALKKAPKEHPTDYFVPQFGQDKEIKTTQKSIVDAENFIGHKFWVDTKPKEDPPRNYFVPDFGMDHDISVSLNNLNNQEQKHGKMSIPDLVQLDSTVEREPLLAKVGTQKWRGPYKINYFVP